MKRLFVILAVLLTVVFTASAQDVETEVISEPVDSVQTYHEIIHSLGGSITTSDTMETAMTRQIRRNSNRKIMGYRLRIFFDNGQNARGISAQVEGRFKEMFPEVPTYRVYVNPYFKVTVGNFRHKSDAMRFLEAVKPHFPSVFLVKESFSTI